MPSFFPLAWFGLVGCQSSYQGTDYTESLTGITVAPATLEVRTGTAESEDLTVAFQATGTYTDGTSGVLPLVAWSLSNRSAGTIDEQGLFTPSQTNGGRTWIKAQLAGLEGSAEVTVILEQTLNDEGLDTSAFDGEAAALETDPWLYPEDGVNVPRNTPNLAFQWSDLGAEAYALQLTSPITDTLVYTTATTWEAGEWWPVIASTNAGGTLEASLSAVVDGTLVTAEPRTLQVNRMDATGSIFYWTSSTEGFMRLPIGSETPETYLASTTGACVGCHAISSAGVMAFTYGTTAGPMGFYDMADDTMIVGLDEGTEGRFKTFSPDGAWLLAARDAQLVLHDGLSGTWVEDVPHEGLLTHPDWSPDGSLVAVTVALGHQHDVEIYGGRIAVMAHLGDGTFGPVEVLVAPEEPYQAFYPTFSPDGRWIAFNQSSGNAYDDPDAELWVVSVDGGEPVRLDAANQEGELTNSWPRWAPLPDDDVLWLAFSSRRPYGLQVDGEPQVWISAFDPARAEAGEDPSWPAFWLPGQSVAHNNHRPVWVED